MTLEEIQVEFSALGFPKYRASQVNSWLLNGTHQFSDMTNLSLDMRKKLDEMYLIPTIQIADKQNSNLDSTVKYLFRLSDGQYIESVVMEYKYGYTICVSTQAGCKMGCDFCATGKGGFNRNLAPSEILLQVQKASEDLQLRISNVVLMGMGEPLDNYDNVIRFLELISSPEGLNIGMRHITLSTCGLCDKIYELADEKLQLTLSISLHAPNNKIRDKLMPINKKYPIEQLIKACKYYINKTNRRISFEYAMIHGVNDNIDCAKELSNLLRNMNCHVNLIPVNEIKDTKYSKSNSEQLIDFCNILSKDGINATIRRTLGKDIDASCGQLKGKKLQ